MDPEEIVAETQTVEEQEGSKPSPEKSPEKPKRTDAEIAAFNLQKHAETAKKLGLDPAAIIGITPKVDEDEDSTPVTVGMLKKRDQAAAQQTALQLADAIDDEDTKVLVKQYLTDNIKPSGNADADFRLALAAAAAPKNTQVIEEINRYTSPKRGTSGGSAPAHVADEFVPTAEEQWHMTSFGISKEKVLEARKKTAAKQG